jgi:hypothetical protein
MILITALLMLLTLLDWKLSPIRVLFAIALVTILPGYALTSAIFANTPLGIQEKIAFSFGFSLGIASLGGLLLNYTRWGIQAVSWVILLGSISLIASVIALARMKDESQVDLRVVQIPLRVRQIVLMLFGAAALFGVYMFARTGAENQPLPTTTRVWMMWVDEAHTEVTVGVQNQENVPMEYRLQLSSLQGQLEDWAPLTLEPGETWEIHYAVPANVAESDFLKATLFRSDQPNDVYREVFLRRVLR